MAVIESEASEPFPDDPRDQLKLAVQAVFESWRGKRAHDYRSAAGIPHDLSTAVNVMAWCSETWETTMRPGWR